MTTIQDKITYFDGSVATGKIVVTWPPFDYGGIAIAAGQQEYAIAPDGSVLIQCYPTIGAQPFGTYYTATYELDKGAAYDEYWMVPTTPTTTIGAIRVSVPETPSIMINAQQLTSSGAQSGMFLGWNGSSWVPMYPSSFNSAVQSFNGRTGAIMPLTGDYTVGQVTNAVANTRRVIAGAGLAGGGALTSDVTLTLAAGAAVPPTRQVLAGAGLAGGGPLTSDVTLSLAAGAAVPPTTQIIAGSGLTGGGPLTGNVTLAVVAGMFALQTTQVIAGAGLSGGGPLSANVTLSLATGAAVPPSTRVIAGYGLSGGGPLIGNVTLAVVDNSNIQKLQLAQAGAVRSTRHQLNFVAGTGINLTLTDDSANDQGTLIITAMAQSAVTSVFTRVGDVLAQAVDYAAFYVPLTRQIVAGTGLSGGGPLSANVGLTANPMVASGASHAPGMVPDPGSTAGATRYLREDATWAAPPGGTGAVTSVFTRTGAVVALATDYAAFYVPLARQVLAGTGLIGGGALSADVSISAQAMAASGASHSGGVVPDPGATAGATRFLREDATWAVPAGGTGGGGSQTPWLSAIDAAGWALNNTGPVGVGTQSSGGVPLKVMSLPNAANETLQLSASDSASTLALVLRGYGPECGLVLSTATAASATWRNLAAIYSKVDIGFLKASYPGDGAATEYVRILSANGNVGLSQSSPQFRLDLTGDCNVTGVYRVNGVAISTGVTSVFTRTGAVVALAADYSAFYVPLARQVIAGVGLTGGGALSADVTLTAKAMVASGASHSAGMVPDPGATAGTAKFLREDATWVVPPVGSQTPWTSDIDAASHKLNNVGSIGIGTAASGSIGVNISSLSIFDGFLQSNSSSNGYAGLNLQNDAGHGLALRMYGTARANPDIGRMECTTSLAIVMNNSECMRITTAGNVGIGTTTPIARLSLGSAVISRKLAVYETASDFFGFGVAASTLRYDAGNGSDHVFFTTGGTERMRITNGGNVGIGTANPLVLLETFGAGGNPATSGVSQVAASLRISRSGGTNVLDLGSYTTPPFGLWLQGGDSSNLATTYPIVLQPNGGNVGIGTASPGAKLTVAGNIGVQVDAANLATNLGLAQLALSGLTDTHKSLWLGFDTTANVGVIQAGVSGVSWNALILNPQGSNVGIGTAAPSSQLHVYGPGQATAAPSTSSGLGGTIYAHDSGGGVGNGGMVMFGFATGAFAAIKGYVQSGQNNTVGDLLFATRRSVTDTTLTEAMRITTVGSVGIGTGNPNGTLEVQRNATDGGTILRLSVGATNGFDFSRTEATGALLVQGNQTGFNNICLCPASGNVGIGTAGPQSKLAVIAAANPSTPQTASQITIGEASNNVSYRLALGYYVDTAFKGVIQSSDNGFSGGTLLLNPLGGNVGIGTTAPAGQFSLGYITNDANVRGWPNMDQGCLAFYVTQNFPAANTYARVLDIVAGGGNVGGFIRFITQVGSAAGAVAMLITSTGFVGVNKTNPGYALDVAGDINCSGTYRVNGSPVGASDAQIKRNVQPLTGGLPQIMQLRPVTAEWNGLASTCEGERVVSVIAQEVQPVIPEAVGTFQTKLRPEDSSETELLSINTMAIVSHLILAVQQLSERLGKANL